MITSAVREVKRRMQAGLPPALREKAESEENGADNLIALHMGVTDYMNTVSARIEERLEKADLASLGRLALDEKGKKD